MQLSESQSRELFARFRVYASEICDKCGKVRCMDVRIRTSQRAGQLISEMPKSNGRPGPGRGKKGEKGIAKGDGVLTLSELGITRDQSSQWKELAGIKPCANQYQKFMRKQLRKGRPHAGPRCE